MPCFAPRMIVNRKYVRMAGSVQAAIRQFAPVVQGKYSYVPRDFYLVVRCGKCLDCQRYRSTMWTTRILHEYEFVPPEDRNRVKFVTLTIAPRDYDNFKRDASYMIRKFLERYRKAYGRSFKHWICSEYGKKRGRLHFHGIFFDALCSEAELRKLWKYGRVSMSTLRSDAGILYVAKYVTKYIEDNFISSDQRAEVWASPGIGRSYALAERSRAFHHQDHMLVPVSVDSTGQFFRGLPRYYRDLLFSPPELDTLKSQYLDSLYQLPQPPYIVGRRQFSDLSSYFREIHRIGGRPILLDQQYDLLTPQQKLSYDGK